ncbi:hypothetical protein FUA25_06910 [Chryseobacterium sp.]|nr:hypothetical protein FUA25_06910 [Chryseobacterium sp.]
MKASMLAVLFSGISFTNAQENSMRAYLAPEKYSRGIFEDPKVDAPEYDGVKVSVGGDFALQFQGLKHSTEGTLPAGVTLIPLGKDVNLPEANLDLNAYLSTGVKMHLRTYLSARHHNEAWVKGGYIQIDNLDFISKGFMSNIMKYARVRVGMDDLNYGDAHFRRSDGAYTINNPFVENNIMDSFTTQPYAEFYGFYQNFIGMVGASNGKMNQTVVNTATSNINPSIYAKIGFDKQIDSDLRLRLTGSVIKTSGLTTNGQLFGDDRTGSRYYYVLLTSADQAASAAKNSSFGTDNPSTGRFNPGFKDMTAFQINPFIKYRGFEFFGTIERASGNKVLTVAGVPTKRDSDGAYNQFAGDLLYRFGSKEQFYIGGKYNTVSGKDFDAMPTRKVDRWNIDAGWFLTKNILAKAEYVNQKYDNSLGWGTYTASTNTWNPNTALYGGNFKGFMLEATIGF